MAPPKGQMRPSRYLIALAAIFIVLYGVLLGFGHGSFTQRLSPKLGLDLAGGTQLTLIATAQNGQQPTPQNLELARQIIQNRVDGLGVAEAEVVTEGGKEIVISAPGENSDTLQKVGVPAQLRFRKVLNQFDDVPAAAPSPTASATPTPTTTTPKPAATTPKPTATSASAAAAGGSASPSPSASATSDNAALQASVIKKLGQTALSTATSLIQQPPTSLTDLTSDVGTMAALEPFRTLTPAEVAILPPQIQLYVPQITCQTLNERPPGSIVSMSNQAVACEDKSDTKLLLDKSTVQGTDVSDAQANIDSTAGGAWKVDLTFSGEGADKWRALTSEAFNNTGGACADAAMSPKSDGSGGKTCRVAIVLDNTVVSSPAIQQVLSTQSSISGGNPPFSQETAQLLANQLKYGALPLTFNQGDLTAVSATLGTDYLRAGLLAAGIGLLLVVVYAFFYYRLLGSVITLSLILSGLLTFGMLVLLGRQIGFTLSLAGIAGFIVSLGVAADSFVIYFERLKDEIREGRSPRSAVSRAWLRARRTILTANVITIMAAVVLYLIGVSSVKGFAFALGLATILDLLIVFLFRHPMMSMLARSPAFLSPRVSGLGRVLHHAAEDEPKRPTRTRRPKEA